MITIDDLRIAIKRELAWIQLPARRAALESLLIEPRIDQREWDYGDPNDAYPCWVVAEAPEQGIILVWCGEGFGPRFPWGFLFTNQPNRMTLGTDAQWSWYLEEAFVRSGLWSGPRKRHEAWDDPPEERRRTELA